MTPAKPDNTSGSGDKPSSKSRIPLPPKTAEEIIAAGARAASLLNSDQFNLAYSQLYESYSEEFINTAPHETNKREYAYVKIQVLSDVALALGALVNNAAATAAELEAKKLEEKIDARESNDAES